MSCIDVMLFNVESEYETTRRLHRRSLRLPTRRKWAQSGYLCTTPSTAQAGADAGFLGLKVGGGS